MFAAAASTMTAAMRSACSSNARADGVEVVVGQHEGLRRGLGGDARRRPASPASRRRSRPRPAASRSGRGSARRTSPAGRGRCSRGPGGWPSSSPRCRSTPCGSCRSGRASPTDTRCSRARRARSRPASRRRTTARARRPAARPRQCPGCACPRIAGPHDATRSTYSRPSASVTYAPFAPTRKRGVPPTEPYARTGEFTPPGIAVLARLKSWSFVVGAVLIGGLPGRGDAGEVRGAAGGAEARVLVELARDVDREVGQDRVGAGALDADETTLMRGGVAVDPAVLRRPRDHRVLAGDLVGPDRHGLVAAVSASTSR